jgi:hypothetical protein
LKFKQNALTQTEASILKSKVTIIHLHTSGFHSAGMGDGDHINELHLYFFIWANLLPSTPSEAPCEGYLDYGK